MVKLFPRLLICLPALFALLGIVFVAMLVSCTYELRRGIQGERERIKHYDAIVDEARRLGQAPEQRSVVIRGKTNYMELLEDDLYQDIIHFSVFCLFIGMFCLYVLWSPLYFVINRILRDRLRSFRLNLPITSQAVYEIPATNSPSLLKGWFSPLWRWRCVVRQYRDVRSLCLNVQGEKNIDPVSRQFLQNEHSAFRQWVVTAALYAVFLTVWSLVDGFRSSREVVMYATCAAYVLMALTISRFVSKKNALLGCLISREGCLDVEPL